jgi:ribosomal protein L37AE/L43A
MAYFILMTKIPIANNLIPEELKCTTCLLPMQYQTMRDDKFMWQCFKCGKQYLVSKNIDDSMEESWSPPR